MVSKEGAENPQAASLVLAVIAGESDVDKPKIGERFIILVGRVTGRALVRRGPIKLKICTPIFAAVSGCVVQSDPLLVEDHTPYKGTASPLHVRGYDPLHTPGVFKAI